MAVITRPGPTVAQLSDALPTGEPMLSVVARRTYALERGRLVPADVQSPLVGEPVMDREHPLLLAADSDLHTYKPRSDVVIHGHAYGVQGGGRSELVVRVDRHEHRIAVFGERRVSLAGSRLRFSEPAPIDRVPLHHGSAYGGRDRGAEAVYGNPLLTEPSVVRSFEGIDLDAASPFIYPRNPAGRGYLVEPTPEAVERLQLPLLEDPTDLLSPDRIVTGWVDRWYRMPLPYATGWIDYNWYPRVAYFGIVPVVDAFEQPPIEAERGLIPAYLADGTGQRDPSGRQDVACGAPLGLQRPHLRGGEAVELRGAHRSRGRWSLAVPPAPKISTDGRNGRMNATQPVVHTLLLEPDAERVTIVWRGCAPALRPYAPAELEQMPLRVEWSD